MMIPHRIHFVKLPPIKNVEPPSNLREIPARTRDTNAIAGRTWSSRRMMSAKICGVAITDLPELEGERDT